MLLNDRQKLISILQALSNKLDIPDHIYEDATLKYEDVGEHLSAEDSSLFHYNPTIYAQGSFRLGTVVQPYGRGDEYDIDLVCQLEIKKESVSQKELKAKVGDRLMMRDDLARLLEPSRRCWTLGYPAAAGMPSFHMDVLPSIPNEETRPAGILLTDTELTRWQKSNPLAYADWFKTRMEAVFLASKAEFAESIRASIEEVPDWRVRTPLQRCIQILKRHRDIYFEDKPDVKPVSIIITTLAAHAYQNEEDLFTALTGIAGRMASYIENRNGRWWVQNPVEDGENFADKWNEYPERRTAFMAWLERVSVDFKALSEAATVDDGLFILDESFGRQTMDMVAVELGVNRASRLPVVAATPCLVPDLGSSSHAISPATQFQLALNPLCTASIRASVYFSRNGKPGRFLWPLGDKPVPKGVWLKFILKTNVQEPYFIRWQVVNTGEEAIRDNQPRGDFYNAEDPDKHVRWEPTAYRGTHWVEAFVLNACGVCVARSGKFFVKVR
jgi:hypothetical protein